MHVLRSEREDDHMLKAARRAKIVGASVLHLVFVCVVSKNLKPSKLSPMAYDTITRGGIGSLVPPVYICVVPLKWWMQAKGQ